MKNRLFESNSKVSGFSLIEVVLAIGIFLVTVLALVGLLGPTLQSVDEVEKTDEVSSIVNTVNAFLQNSPDIAPNASKFNAIYGAVAGGNEATLFVYRYYETGTDSAGNPIVRLEVGFNPSPVEAAVDALSLVDTTNAPFSAAAGPIYRVVLTPSSVLPENGTDSTGATVPYRFATRDTNTGVYALGQASVSNYNEGYFAMEVRIYGEDPPGPSAPFSTATDLTALKDKEPIFTYNTAVVR